MQHEVCIDHISSHMSIGLYKPRKRRPSLFPFTHHLGGQVGIVRVVQREVVLGSSNSSSSLVHLASILSTSLMYTYYALW